MPTSCTGGNVIVKIVDHNPGAATIINLSATAFALIADPNAGSVYVDVQAQITELIVLLLKAYITCKNKNINNSYMLTFVFAETTVIFEVDDVLSHNKSWRYINS